MHIRLLGPVQVLKAGQAVELRKPQYQLVLAALAVDAGKPVSVKSLVRRVWDDERPELDRARLQPILSGLRRLFREHSDAPRLVQISPRTAWGYALVLDDVDQVDVLRMERLWKRARQEADAGERLRLLREAVGLWDGDPLAGLKTRWAEATRSRWRDEQMDLLREWASTELQAGNAVGMTDRLRRFVHDDGLSDHHLAALLKEGLDATGREQKAPEFYRSASQRAEKNGQELDPELRPGEEGERRDDLVARRPQQRTGTVGMELRRERDAGAPLLVGLLPPRADNFQDRVQSRMLDSTAGPGQTTVLTQVVAGLGGVGKTQLAADFARRLWRDGQGELDLLIWVSALTRDSVVSSYAQAAADLGLARENEDRGRVIERFLSWLAKTRQSWLIVIDDLLEPDHIRGLWPPDQPSGRTVITTRRRDADLLARASLVDVGVFAEDEAKAYIVRKFKDGGKPWLADDVDAIVSDLGALPLALSQAVVYMLDLDESCRLYLERFRDRQKQLEHLFPGEKTRYDGYAHTVATTWDISVQEASRISPVGFARPLMEIVSALSPNGIPEEVMTRARAAQAYLTERVPSRPDPRTIRDGLRGLHRFHLVTHEAGVVRVHALVQRAVREQLKTEQSVAVARVSADALLEIWPSSDSNSNGEMTQFLRANAMALQDNWPDAIWHGDHGMHPVMTRAVHSFGMAVELNEAIRLGRLLSHQADLRLGPSGPGTRARRDQLALRNQLAAQMGDNGQLQEAIHSLGILITDIKTAIEGAEIGHAPGPDPSPRPDREAPDRNAIEELRLLLIEARRNLGYQRGQAGYPAAAVTELTAVLADQARVLGPEHPAVIGTRAQRAYWQSKAGDSAHAVTELEGLVELATRILGARERQTLEIRGMLAYYRAEVVGHAQSVREMQEVLAEMQAAFGPDDRDVSVLRNNLASQQGKAGDWAGSAAELRKLADEREKSPGPYHRDTVATRHSLSKMLVLLEQFAEAATQLDEVIEGMCRLVGPKHPDTLHRRYELACVYIRMDRHHQEQAADILRAVLDDQITILGDSHESVAATGKALARVTGILHPGRQQPMGH